MLLLCQNKGLDPAFAVKQFKKLSEFKITRRAITITQIFCTSAVLVSFMGDKIIQYYFFMLTRIHNINQSKLPYNVSSK